MSLLFLAKKLPGNHQFLNFAGAFPDSAELHVAVVLLGWIILDETVAAMNLHALVGHAHRDFAGKQFRHARFASESHVIFIREPRRLKNQQPRRFHLSSHVRQLELHRLKLADRLPKLFSLLGVFRGCFKRALRHAQRERRNRNPSSIENLQAASESFAFRPKQVFLRHAAIVENHFRRVARAHPH